MTLAQNLLRLLNGNNSLCFLLLLVLISSCATTSPSPGGDNVITPDKPTQPEKEIEVIPVDTVQWTFVSEEENPPISANTEVASWSLEKVNKEYYRIALMLPVRIEQIIPNLDANNKKFADFYAGIKMAAEESNEVQAHVKVYYTNRQTARMNEIIEDLKYDKPDLIIGPYETKLISLLADFAKEERIPLISPWKSNTGITDQNLFYLQLRPGIEHYFKRIVDHVNYNFDRSQVGIIQRAGGQDNAKTRLIEKINQESSQLPVVQPYQVINIELDSLMDSEANVFDTLLQQDLKAFIIPHFSTRDEAFIYSCVRKMYGEKNGREFAIYTMPVTLNSERIDINILKNLNIRTAEFRFPDPLDPSVQDFRKKYYNQYGWLPSEDSYYGYDLMKFIKYGLVNHGQYFHYFMIDDEIDLMQMKIHIQPYFKNESGDMPEFLVNDHLYIIEYNQDRFEVKGVR